MNFFHKYKLPVSALLLAISLCCTFQAYSGGAPKYSVTPFPDRYWCQSAPYPTSYVAVGTFSINETAVNGFKNNQNDNIIITLPAGFQFNTAVGTVTFPPGRDISSIAINSLTATQLDIQIVIPSGGGGQDAIDTIYYNNFEIRAMAAGNSGDLVRTGGTFEIDNSDNNPTSTESLGYLFADVPMVYDSSRVSQVTTAPVRKSCPADNGILEIKISVSFACPALLDTFNFTTLGSSSPAGDIAAAKVYYTGKTQGFSTSTLFGTYSGPFIDPITSFTIPGSQRLLDGAGDYYFYLSYDITPGALVGNLLDANLVSFVFDGSTKTDMADPNPTGSRTINDELCLRPDLPNPPPNLDTMPTGALVIPMDTANQSLGTLPFNLKAYGLVHELLMNDVPVNWVIRSGKAKNDTDFVSTARRVFPDTTAPAVVEFRASAFIVDTAYIDKAKNGFVKTARQAINDYGNNVAVYELQEDEIVDVRYLLTQRPKIAVFNNGGNQPIHIEILDSGGVTNYVAIDAGVFPGLDECYTFCSEPHWAATPADTPITQKVWDFVYSGGNFMAQCRGMQAYESNELFHTTDDIIVSNTTVAHAYYNNDLAFMQFEGPVTENEGGSERNWIRAAGSFWRNGFYYGISDNPETDTVVASGAHLVNPDSVGGNVFYLGGHDYSPFSTLERINAARLYLNATLVPAGKPTDFPLDPGANRSICNTDSTQLGGAPTGPVGSTYQWSPGATLDDSTASNPWAKPSDTTTYSVLVTQGGCVVGPRAVTVFVNPNATVDAGPNDTICADSTSVPVSGTVANATGQIWTTAGTGTFDDDTLLSTNYNPSAADTAAGSVYLRLTPTGGCGGAIDSMLLTMTPIPVANAGPDDTVCANNSTVVLSGTIFNAGGGIWSTGGTGTFGDPFALLTTYSPSDADTLAGSVTITLTSTGNGGCSPATDIMIITITDAPVVNAGTDQTVCADTSGVPLSGSVSGVFGGGWTTSGTGVFLPDASTLSATYVPSAADTAAPGFVTLTLTSTGNGNCLAVSDAMNIFITPAPSVDAGPNDTLCANDSVATLAGSFTTAGRARWTTGGTGTFADDTIMTTTYTPSSADIGSGFVTITLTTENNGNCNAVSDTMVLTYTPAPTVSAGPNDTVCQVSPIAFLNGSYTISGGIFWTTLGGPGGFANPTDTNTTYTPSAADIAAGTVTLVITTTSNGNCIAVTDTTIITIRPPITVNAGPNDTVCANNSDVTLSGTVVTATGGVWTTGGSGTFSDSSDLGTTYFPSDADTLAGSVLLTLTSTGNGGCPAVSDTMRITITNAPVVNAGPDTSVCSNNPVITLSGIVSGATGGYWARSGTGTFSPDSSVLSATYNASNADTLAGSVMLTLTSTGNGICLAVQDSFILTITDGPIADAGPDDTVCANNAVASLSGSYTVATGIVWGTGGTGVFADPTDTTTTYTPSAADTAAGTVTITLTTTGNGSCIANIDTLLLTITDAPTANAGPDKSVCASNPNTLLTGIITNATGCLWTTTGTGTFNPDNITCITTYEPSIADTVPPGLVTNTLTTTGNGICNAVSDGMLLTITSALTVDAGPDDTVCMNLPGVSLNGNVPTTGIWTTTGSGSFSPNDSDMFAIYTATPSDSADGSIKIYLTSTNNGSCAAATDSLTLVINEGIYINAGPNDTVCANNASDTLSGSVTGASGGIWTTGGTGTFDDSTLLNAIYFPDSADTAAGTVTLVLSSTGNGACATVSDTMTIVITPAPVVNAGIDFSICANNASDTLSGTVSGGATTGVWTTLGTGFFADSSGLNTIYTQTDTSAGSVKLVLTSTNFGSCVAVTDTVEITITPAPIVNAGPDDTVCVNLPDVVLSGSVSGGASTGVWTTLGTGTFIDSSDLGTTYTPGNADTAAAFVLLVLTSTNQGNCLPVTDTMRVTINPGIYVNNDTAVTVCANNADVAVASSVTGATGGLWSSSGDGTFDDPDSLNTIYHPGVTDISMGFVTLTLTTTGNGPCLAVTQNVFVTITPAPTVNAGPDKTVCSNNAVVSLSGSKTVASGSVWSTPDGTGIFGDTLALITTYAPSDADTAAGSVTIVLTTTGSGLCNEVSDTMLVTIEPVAITVIATTADPIVCANNALVDLAGSSVTGALGGVWNSSSSGILGFDNPFIFNAKYTPNPVDTGNGFVTLKLTSTGNGLCSAVSDSTTVTITDAPYVNAGPDDTVCANDADVALSASIGGGASTGVWSTSGSGSFIPTSTTLTATYIPSAADTAAGLVTLILTTTDHGIDDCNAVSDIMTITITPVPVVNAGNDQIVCIEFPYATMAGSVSGPTTTGFWTTLGDGTFTPDSSALNARYDLGTIDTTTGSVTLFLTSTNNGKCIAVTDTMKITVDSITPIVIATTDDSIVCANNANITLVGSVSNGTSTGIWSSSSDSGIFIPFDTSLTATYIPGDYDTLTGSVQLILTATNACPITDTVDVIITDAPYVFAGNDTSVCVTNDTVYLNGTVTAGASTGAWTTSGSGIFLNDTLLSTEYYPSSADSTAGAVFLILTSTYNGNCNPEVDSLRVTITTIPFVDAGPDDTACASSPVQLNGIVTGGFGTGQWSTLGSGTFVPDDDSLNANYIFSVTDTTAGFVELVLTSTFACDIDRDTMRVEITPAPSVNAGSDITVCANNDTVYLSGSVSGLTTTGVWSTTGSGVFSPNDSDLINAKYIPSDADTAAGTVTIVLTSTNNGGCAPVRDTMLVTITPAPFVYAGPDKYVCVSEIGSALNGISVTYDPDMNKFVTGYWSTSGTGFFLPDSSFLNASYIYSSEDRDTGYAFLILTSANNFDCIAVSDTMLLRITEIPVVDAGPADTVCANNALVNISGSVNNIGGTITTGRWSTLGSGVFGDADSLATTYTPGVADISAGFVNLILTSTNNKGCSAKTDTLFVTITPAPTVNAGLFSGLCENIDSVLLNGVITIAGGGIWSGSGSFSPADTILNAVYLPTGTEINTGVINLALTSTYNGDCFPVSDSLSVIYPKAGINPLTICVDEDVTFTESSTIQGDSIVSWLWDFGDGDSAFVQNPTHTYDSMKTYNVTLTVVSDKGCKSTVSYNVNIATLIAGFEVDSNTLNLLGTEFIDTSTGAINWYWDFGDSTTIGPGAGFITGVNNPTGSFDNPTYLYSFTEDGTFAVIQVVSNTDGCRDTFELKITLNLQLAPAVPTAFTPNGNGENDVLYVKGGPYKELEFKIYNDWGELIFVSNKQEDGWDGKKDGVEQPVGVYVYILNAVTLNNVEVRQYGDVTLIR